MLAMCTHAQPEQLSWQEAGGFHSLAGARDDWSHRHGGARVRRLVERPISVDRDDVGNCNARSPGA
jgi:hypothetical protein